MSKFVIDLNKQNNQLTPQANAVTVEKKRGCGRILRFLGIGFTIFLLVGSVVAYVYWQSVKKSPQYSMALLIDAARKDDKEKVSQIIDTEAVVNNFVPQITDKATELYGRNLPAPVISRITQIVVPLMPAIKEKAKSELPQLIREKTEKLDRVPYWAIALFAERELSIKIDGDVAQITSKNPNQPAEFTMKRNGELWKIIAIKDEKLSEKVAAKLGQQIMELVSKGNVSDAGKQLGLGNINDILKGLNDIFK